MARAFHLLLGAEVEADASASRRSNTDSYGSSNTVGDSYGSSNNNTSDSYGSSNQDSLGGGGRLGGNSDSSFGGGNSYVSLQCFVTHGHNTERSPRFTVTTTRMADSLEAA
jgi:hypothetical protein